MQHLRNTQATQTRVLAHLNETPFPSNEADRAARLIQRCPRAAETPLRSMPELARMAGVAELHIKDERARMGLGSFKALGAAYVIATDDEQGTAAGQTYVTASAGNHGLSVAAGAAAFGAQAVVYIAETVPAGFAARLERLGARVVREGATYEDSMAAAADAAEQQGWILLSDSSWPGYYDRPWTLMEGYLVLAQEVVAQMQRPPTHVFLQAGVGGLAVACATHFRAAWGPDLRIVVVEPEVAAALYGSMQAGAPRISPGPVSAMGRLDCKEPSLIALKGLARDADDFVLVSEAAGAAASDASAAAGLPTTPSGAAGLAGLLTAADDPARLGLTAESRVLVILSEDAEGA
ncbi:MAG: pyridoxal-phosphate dependent enzyme [Pseudomonadota bacterium]